jgi:uncharacterized metal-binding protein
MKTGRPKLRFTNPVVRSFLSALLAAGVGASGVAAAAEKVAPSAKVSGNVSLVPIVGAAKAEFLRNLPGRVLTPQSPAHHECPGGTPHVQGVACGSTTNDQLTTDGSCQLNDHSYADFYSFSGTSGQSVTITMSATYGTFIYLLDPSATTAATSTNSPGNLTSSVTFTLTSTGTWFIVANGYDPNVVGAYSLNLTCGSAPPPGACTTDATTLCLNNNRFQVRATFATGDGQTGNGMAVTETVDTGLFWFFSASNIEVIIKVVNACSFAGGPRYWVFAGGLTNVQVVLTVTDTQSGITKTYTNPQGTAFAPIQDTNAFATCP